MELSDFLTGLKNTLGVGFDGFHLNTSGGGEPLVVPTVHKDDPTDGTVEEPQTACENWMADCEANNPVEELIVPEPEPEASGIQTLESAFGLKLTKPGENSN